MKIVISIVTLILFLSLIGVSIGESQAVILPDVFYSSLYPIPIRDANVAKKLYLEQIGGEEDRIYISEEGRGFFTLENCKIGQHLVECLDYYVLSEENEITLSIDIQILRPFGETMETSQTYIDTVNHYQSIYGRARGLQKDEERYILNIHPREMNWLSWVDEEKGISIVMSYCEGDIFEGLSPSIKIRLRKLRSENQSIRN